MTDRYAIIGNPVAQSKSPLLQTAFARQLGQDMSYEAILATAGTFHETVRRFMGEGGKGMNVTAPFKLDALDLVDEMSDRARAAQAINTLKFDETGVYGDNTDGAGLVNDIQERMGVSLAGRRLLVIGAGGAALKLLQMSGIPESKDYAGFPVGGQFLAFQGQDVTSRHGVKAYGMAETGSPPMSVPHLDARKLDGKPVVLFGPFALYSTKFLKHGSWWDLYSSVTHNNVGPMLEVGKDNLDLVQYLMGQARLNDADRQAELVKYFPNAKPGDWKLVTAGQRVQIIKRDPLKGPVLQFGTEIVTDKDHTIAALLGASPGASTSPPIMLDLMAKAFPDQMKAGWETRLREIVPSYGRKLNDSAALVNEIRTLTSQTLHLPYLEVPVDASAAAPAPAAVPAPAKEKRNANEELQAL